MSSSGPRIRLTRPEPFSSRLGRSARGMPDFCIARTKLLTVGFSVTDGAIWPLPGPLDTECVFFWEMGRPDTQVSKITGVPRPRLPFRFTPS
jgi:hypothetical protein